MEERKNCDGNESNVCQKCNTVFTGYACPSCGLKYRPRCSGCGARIYYDTGNMNCPECGCTVKKEDLFVK